MKYKYIFYSMTFFLILSCSQHDLRHIEKMINKGEIEKVERLIDENKIQDVKQVKELIFNKILSDIIAYAKQNNIEQINRILNEKEFTQEQYNLICEKLYDISFLLPMKIIDTKIPADTYCHEDTLLMCAVRAQDEKCVKLLLEKGADTSLMDKKNRYNALCLAIEFKTASSTRIFDMILNYTKITGDEKLFPVNKKPFSGWYFERLIQFNQKDMISLFLKKDGITQMITENDFSLRVLTWYTDSFDLIPESIYTARLKIDNNFDYFQTAICRLNYRIIPILVMNKVHPYCHNSDEFIKSFIENPRSKKILLWELDKESPDYEKTIALYPVIKEYCEKWDET